MTSVARLTMVAESRNSVNPETRHALNTRLVKLCFSVVNTVQLIKHPAETNDKLQAETNDKVHTEVGYLTKWCEMRARTV